MHHYTYFALFLRPDISRPEVQKSPDNPCHTLGWC